MLSYTVAQRTREIGIRMALGASSRSVTQLVLGHGVKLTLSGLGAGMALSVLSGRSLAALLFGVTPTDAATFAAVPGVLGVVAALAIWLPTRRAMRVDPIAAIRQP